MIFNFRITKNRSSGCPCRKFRYWDPNKLLAQNDDKTLLGAGSTFIYPLFSKMFSEYNQKTGIQVNYQSIGSGGGILQLTNKTVDFGATDGPLNEEQAKKIGCSGLAYSDGFRRCSDNL